MSKCLKCGKEVGNNETFCTGCGTKLYHCEKCGAVYTPGDVFCEACGSKLPPKEAAPVEQITNVKAEGQNSSLNKIIAGLVALGVIGGGYFGYQQMVVAPREKAASEQRAVAAQEALKQAQKEGVKKEVETLLNKAKIKDEYDQRLTAAANAINSNQAYAVLTSLKELNEEINKSQKDVEELKMSEACKTAQTQLKDLFYNEHLRALGMIRGIRGDGSGYSDGGNAYDKYHEIDAKFQAEIAKLKAL